MLDKTTLPVSENFIFLCKTLEISKSVHIWFCECVSKWTAKVFSSSEECMPHMLHEKKDTNQLMNLVHTYYSTYENI